MSLPEDIINIIIEYAKCYTLLPWIDINKIDWNYLSDNPNAIHLLEANIDKINWWSLSKNPNGINLLKSNKDKIDWFSLPTNSNAVHCYHG